MITLDELIKNAITDLKDWLDDNSGEDVTDIISEIADTAVPVYTYDLFQLASNNLFLATTEPDFYAFDGTPTPVNTIAANVYNHIEEKLNEYYTEVKPKYDALEELEDSLPHGSGINGDWSFELDVENDLITAINSYHAMNDVGMYCCDWPFTATYDLDLNLTDLDIEGDLESCECGYGLDDYLNDTLIIHREEIK